MRRNCIGTITILWLISFSFNGCSSKLKPYDNGPVMGQKDIKKTFGPILQFMQYKPGMAFADVGAGSGALTIMMATLMNNSAVYIQDIDTSVLKESNVKKIIDYYSKETNQDLGGRNSFQITIGELQQTKLPDSTFDLIYSNATVHNFTHLDSMVTDLGRKLKPNGVLFLRDSFKDDHGEGEYCSDPKCARPLLSTDDLLAVMKRNGFEVVMQEPDMSGYPVFGFALTK